MFRRRAIAITGMLALGVLLTIFVSFQRARTASVVKLKGGGFAALRRVSYATTDRIGEGNFAARMLGPIVSPRVAGKLGFTILAANGTNQALIAWVEVGTIPKGSSYHLAIEDESGVEGQRYFPSPFLNLTNRAVMGYVIPVLPRRSRNMTLNLHEVTGTNAAKVASFKRRNPGVSSIPAWPPQPLPATVETNGVPITLLRCDTGLTATGMVTSAGSSWTEFRFRVAGREPGRRDITNREKPSFGDWVIKSIACRNAHGDFIQARPPSGQIAHQSALQYTSVLDDGVALLKGGLWPEETWKVQVEIQPSRTAKLPMPSTITFSNVPLPEPGITNHLTISNLLEGRTLILSNVTVVRTPASNTNELAQKLQAVYVDTELITPERRDELLLVRAVDNVGRTGSHLGGMPHRPKQFRFTTTKGATSANITLGVGRIYTAEFVVKPTVVRTNVAHWMSSRAGQ